MLFRSENEADENGYFTSYAKYGETRMSRTFGMMPFPKVDNDHIGEVRTIITDLNNSEAFISKRVENNPDKLKLAKKFLQFLHTDDELQNFTVNTSTNKPLEYSMPATKIAQMSPYGQDIASMRNNSNIDMVYTMSSHPTFINNASKMWRGYIDFDNRVYSRNVIYEFHNSKTLTCADFFAAIRDSKDENWLTKA